MSRNQILAVGALLWTVAILDGLVHVVTGAWVTALVMLVAGILGATWIVMRPRRRTAAVPVSED